MAELSWGHSWRSGAAAQLALVLLSLPLLRCGGSSETQGTATGGASGLGGATSTAGNGGSAPSGGTITLDPMPSADKVPECYQQIDPGSCQTFETRYAFDSTSHSCVTFQYGGCGGNQNNFTSQHACVDYCYGLQTCSCADSDPSCTTQACTTCPADLAHAQGTACDTSGLTCVMQTSKCTCAADSSGNNTWDCKLAVN